LCQLLDGPEVKTSEIEKHLVGNWASGIIPVTTERKPYENGQFEAPFCGGMRLN